MQLLHFTKALHREQTEVLVSWACSHALEGRLEEGVRVSLWFQSVIKRLVCCNKGLRDCCCCKCWPCFLTFMSWFSSLCPSLCPGSRDATRHTEGRLLFLPVTPSDSKSNCANSSLAQRAQNRGMESHREWWKPSVKRTEGKEWNGGRCGCGGYWSKRWTMETGSQECGQCEVASTLKENCKLRKKEKQNGLKAFWH